MSKEIEHSEKSKEDEIEQKFGLKAINNENDILKRLEEVKKNFYNRLESSKLIKK